MVIGAFITGGGRAGWKKYKGGGCGLYKAAILQFQNLLLLIQKELLYI
jgi:hypothetical protein